MRGSGRTAPGKVAEGRNTPAGPGAPTAIRVSWSDPAADSRPRRLEAAAHATEGADAARPEARRHLRSKAADGTPLSADPAPLSGSSGIRAGARAGKPARDRNASARRSARGGAGEDGREGGRARIRERPREAGPPGGHHHGQRALRRRRPGRQSSESGFTPSPLHSRSTWPPRPQHRRASRRAR